MFQVHLIGPEIVIQHMSMDIGQLFQILCSFLKNQIDHDAAQCGKYNGKNNVEDKIHHSQ